MHSMLFHVCFSPLSTTWSISEGGFPALVIASEHANWLPYGDDPLQGITSYIESSIPENLLAKIQDLFGNKIPNIANAMQPEVDHSQYEKEVADPLTDVVMNNLLRMPIDLLYYTNLLISSPIARPQQPLKRVTEALRMPTDFLY